MRAAYRSLPRPAGVTADDISLQYFWAGSVELQSFDLRCISCAQSTVRISRMMFQSSHTSITTTRELLAVRVLFEPILQLQQLQSPACRLAVLWSSRLTQGRTWPCCSVPMAKPTGLQQMSGKLRHLWTYTPTMLVPLRHSWGCKRRVIDGLVHGAGVRRTAYARSRWCTCFQVRATRRLTCYKYMTRHSKTLMLHCWRMPGRYHSFELE